MGNQLNNINVLSALLTDALDDEELKAFQKSIDAIEEMDKLTAAKKERVYSCLVAYLLSKNLNQKVH